MSELERCVCGRLVELLPSTSKVTILATGTEVEGVLMGSCSCGAVRIRLPKLAEEALAELKTLVAEGGKTGLSVGYNGADVRDADSSPGPGARRPRVGRPVPPAFRPRRK